LTNDDNLGSFRKFGHVRLLLGKWVAGTGCADMHTLSPIVDNREQCIQAMVG
jgi:hypothetical protein